jgi:hypothetical protein
VRRLSIKGVHETSLVDWTFYPDGAKGGDKKTTDSKRREEVAGGSRDDGRELMPRTWRMSNQTKKGLAYLSLLHTVVNILLVSYRALIDCGWFALIRKENWGGLY